MLLKHALQMVLTVSTVVSASCSDTLRLGSLRGPPTTALHVIPLRFRWRSQDLRRQTYPPYQCDTAPQDWRYWARRGQRNLDPFLDLLRAGTKFQETQLDRGHRSAGPGGGLYHFTAQGLKQHRGCRMQEQAYLIGFEAVTGGRSDFRESLWSLLSFSIWPRAQEMCR